jgi:hypothetical protein
MMRTTGRITMRWMAAPLLVVALGCGGPQEPDVDRLYGFWESTSRSHTGVGNSLELLPDSTTTKMYASMKKFRFRVEGDSIFTCPVWLDSALAELDSLPEAALAFAVHGDTLFKAVGSDQFWLERVGAVDAPDVPLYGAWRLARSTRAITIHSFERYTRDGTLESRLPLRMVTGTYTVVGDTLLLNYEGEDLRRVHYEFVGDTLRIARIQSQAAGDTLEPSATRGKTYSYLRVADRAWYYQADVARSGSN